MDWIPHIIIILTALVHTVSSQVVVELAKCYRCASAPTTEGRRYLAEVQQDYNRLGYTEFDDVLAPCGDPFTRAAGRISLCDNGYGCLKTHIELPNMQMVILRGCAKYSVCRGGRVYDAPASRGDVRVRNYCCQDAYCNKSAAIHTNTILLIFIVTVALAKLFYDRH